jgi:hypothetical protein
VVDCLRPVAGVVHAADLLVFQTLADLKGHENSVESVGFCHSYASPCHQHSNAAPCVRTDHSVYHHHHHHHLHLHLHDNAPDTRSSPRARWTTPSESGTSTRASTDRPARVYTPPLLPGAMVISRPAPAGL